MPAIPLISTLEDQLVALIQERLLETAPDFSASSDLYEAGLDSMAIMQLLLLIEGEYGIMLPDSDLSKENFTSVRNLALLLQTRLADT
jgi:acyl carrier protein